jgi:hypothetical protein
MPFCCRICSTPIFYPYASATVLGHSIYYYDCSVCGYCQSEEPFWLQDAYKNSINDSDTGILARNFANVFVTTATLAFLGKQSGKVLDCAGGYGVLVRLLRDYGIDAHWTDAYSENILAKGFSHINDTLSYDLVTCFEAFEHFTDPLSELLGMLKYSNSVLISTSLISDPPPKPSAWDYYGLDHGQHIGFFRPKTLLYLANKTNTFILSNGSSIHLFLSHRRSSFIWQFYLNLFRRFPIISRFFFKSKTYSDYLLIADRIREASK